MTSTDVKQLLFSLGADLCGIAGMDRFSTAPEGYHPLDVMPSCKSVIAFACRIPAGSLMCHSSAVYTRVRNSLGSKMDGIALDCCIELDRRGIIAAPIPSNESEWDERTGRKRSIVSLKHAAQAAGLGTIGRHSLLVTPELGSMVWLGAVLTEAELEPDPLLENICTNCGLCVEACPVHALERPEVDQQACLNYAMGEDPVKKSWRISCHQCRDVCPYNFGKRAPFREDT